MIARHPPAWAMFTLVAIKGVCLLIVLVFFAGVLWLTIAHKNDHFYLEHHLTREQCSRNPWCDTDIWDIEPHRFVDLQR